MQEVFEEVDRKQQQLVKSIGETLRDDVLEQIKRNAEKPIIIFKMLNKYPHDIRQAVLYEILIQTSKKAKVFALFFEGPKDVEYCRLYSSNLIEYTNRTPFYAIEYSYNPNPIFHPNFMYVKHDTIQKYL